MSETALLPYCSLSASELTPAMLFEILEKVEFPEDKKCTTRDKVTPKGQYFTLGGVPHYSRSRVTISNETKQRTVLTHLLTKFGREMLGDDVFFTSIQVNKNAAANMHKDDNLHPKYNRVCGIALVDERVWGSNEESPKGNTFLVDGSPVPCAYYRGPEAQKHPLRGVGYSLPSCVPGRILQLKNRFADFEGALPHRTIEEDDWVDQVRARFDERSILPARSEIKDSQNSKDVANHNASQKPVDRTLTGNAMSCTATLSETRYFLGFFVHKSAAGLSLNKYEKLKEELKFPLPPHEDLMVSSGDVGNSLVFHDMCEERDVLVDTDVNPLELESLASAEGKMISYKGVNAESTIFETPGILSEAKCAEDDERAREICKDLEDTWNKDCSSDASDSEGSEDSDTNNTSTIEVETDSGSSTSNERVTSSFPEAAWKKLPDSIPLPRRKKGDSEVICGVAFSGYGAISGPLIAGAVAIPPGWEFPAQLKKGVINHRKLSSKKREMVWHQLVHSGIVHEHAVVSVEDFDKFNLSYLQACQLAQARCLWKLQKNIVVDKILVCGKNLTYIPEGGFRRRESNTGLRASSPSIKDSPGTAKMSTRPLGHGKSISSDLSDADVCDLVESDAEDQKSSLLLNSSADMMDVCKPGDVCVANISDMSNKSDSLTSSHRLLDSSVSLDIHVASSYLNLSRALSGCTKASEETSATAEDHDVDIICEQDMRKSEDIIPAEAVAKGHDTNFLVAAAGFIAKVPHDHEMAKMHAEYPEYLFRKHEGYATPEHKALLMKHGPCKKYHRMSAEPVVLAHEEQERKTKKGCNGKKKTTKSAQSNPKSTRTTSKKITSKKTSAKAKTTGSKTSVTKSGAKKKSKTSQKAKNTSGKARSTRLARIKR